MSIKKYTNNAWVDIPYKKYETATDTITSLPKTIIGDGQNISAYTIKGNMSQSGTPTPSNPIYPTECGDKTANLYDKTAHNTNNGFDDTGYLDSNGNVVDSYSYQVTEYIAVEAEQAYTLVYGTGARYSPSVCFYDSAKNFISGLKYNEVLPRVFTTPQNTAYLRFSIGDTAIDAGMLNIGSTALPYEPFGYKIPILSNGVSYPIYLSEPIRKIGDYVDTAPSTGTASRVIKKLVLDGTEEVGITGNGTFYLTFSGYKKSAEITCMSSHYAAITNPNSAPSTNNVVCFYTGNDMNRMYIRDTTYTTTADFKTYLAAQYANGTPVIVWYALSSSSTETETFTAPTLPTTGTTQSFDVDTTLKPSEVNLTYHGWHEHSDEKYVGGVVNKFNKDDTTIYNAYLNTAGDWLLSSDSRSVKIPCNPNTQYTLSVSESLAVFRIYSSDNANIIPNGERTTPIARSENISQYTFTTGANTACIVFQGSASVVDTWFNSLMLVEGSTVPSEYHPYYEWVEE